MNYSSLEEGQINHNSQDNSLALTKQIQLSTSESIASFLRERLVEDSEASTQIGNKSSPENFLYPQYLQYCQFHNLSPETLNNFSSKLLELCRQIGWQVQRKRSYKGYVLVGLRLRTESDSQDNKIIFFPATRGADGNRQDDSGTSGSFLESCQQDAKIAVLDRVCVQLAPEKVGTVIEVKLTGSIFSPRRPLIEVKVLFEDKTEDLYYLEQLKLINSDVRF